MSSRGRRLPDRTISDCSIVGDRLAVGSRQLRHASLFLSRGRPVQRLVAMRNAAWVGHDVAVLAGKPGTVMLVGGVVLANGLASGSLTPVLSEANRRLHDRRLQPHSGCAAARSGPLAGALRTALAHGCRPGVRNGGHCPVAERTAVSVLADAVRARRESGSCSKTMRIRPSRMPRSIGVFVASRQVTLRVIGLAFCPGHHQIEPDETAPANIATKKGCPEGHPFYFVDLSPC